MMPHKLTRDQILAALKKIDREGVAPHREATKYELSHEGKRYPPKYVVSIAHEVATGRQWTPDRFNGGKETNSFLQGLGFRIVNKGTQSTPITRTDSHTQPASSLVANELEHRKNLWATLQIKGGPKGVSPEILRQPGIYGGAQGIWVDVERTSKLTPDGKGVTVGLLHTGTAYPDEISEDCVLYHYPKTQRPRGRDLSEVEATKAAKTLGLPVFVITYPSPGSSQRDVRLGWVESWDDRSGQFLITYGETAPAPESDDVDDLAPFELATPKDTTERTVATRLGQQRFKFRVFRRYGPECAVCGIKVAEVLDAAHIRPKNQQGSDDPRNGLVLCAIHHRALDAGLFAIEPSTLRVRCRAIGPDARTLRIGYPTLEHLSQKPHEDAVAWRWQRWKPTSG